MGGYHIGWQGLGRETFIKYYQFYLMKKIRTLIVGASGLVGNEILECVSKESQEIFLLSRRTRGIVQENCSEIISDFDDIDNIDFPEVDHVYISIGKKLSSGELMYIRKSDRNDFIKIDFEYVLNIAKKSFNNGAKSIAIVSAIGADKTSKNLYLKTKGNMEDLVKEIGFTKTIFAQPSHLLGQRVDEEFKLDVSLIELGGKIFDPLMLGPLSDLRFIDAKYVAKAMVQKMNDNSEGLSILKYKDFVNA